MFLGQKLRKLQIADSEQIFQRLFSVFPIFDRFIHSFFSKFYAQTIRKNLLNLWIFFDFKNYQPFFEISCSKGKISSIYMY